MGEGLQLSDSFPVFGTHNGTDTGWNMNQKTSVAEMTVALF